MGGRQLRSHVAVAVEWVDSHGSNSTPSLGTFICYRYSPIKKKEEEGEKKKKNHLKAVKMQTSRISRISIGGIWVGSNNLH